MRKVKEEAELWSLEPSHPAVTVVSVRRYRAGYEVRNELHRLPGDDHRPVAMRSAYTPDGAYIGDPKMARLLVVRLGIKPELRTPESRVCSVGFCEREQKWYGWSHRAIVGFGVGDRIFEERYGTSSTPYVRHGRRTIKTMEDARLAACRFAESVS